MSAPKGSRFPLDNAGELLYVGLVHVSPSYWLVAKPSSRRGTRAVAYLVVWTVGLIVMWRMSPIHGLGRTIFVVLAIARWAEIATYSLGLMFNRYTTIAAGSLMVVAIYAVQIVVSFSIIGEDLAEHMFVRQGAHGTLIAATNPFDYLYVSWCNMVTLGSEYTPRSDTARVLVLGAVTSGVLLLGVVAAHTLDLIQEKSNPPV
jgi:hypothetical protein